MKFSTLRLLLLSLFFLGLLAGCTKGSKQEQEPTASPSTTTATAPDAATTGASTTTAAPSTSAVDLNTDANGLSKATVVMKTSKGTVKFKLYAKDAPNTVNRFVELVQSKFYNGLAFHRVVPGFVVQTGDPKSKNKNDPAVGTGGSGKKLRSEFNGRKHTRGTVAMARAADPHSADSQFYIAMGPFPHLDGNYTVFGQVVDFGEKVGDKDVVDRLRQMDDVIDMHIE